MTFQDVYDPMNPDGTTLGTVMLPVGLQPVLTVSSVTNFHFFSNTTMCTCVHLSKCNAYYLHGSYLLEFYIFLCYLLHLFLFFLSLFLFSATVT